ncbi:acetolactate synthase small subunit [Candidatus Woesearchaeota archaeon]|nr:acetolactate synthase small subunit [Candidatus Woesearchaeota archaeon]
MKKHVLSILVNNEPGVLAKISGMFYRRNFNIDTISVGSSEKYNHSRIIIVFSGSESEFEQLIKQLHKLIDVVKITKLENNPLLRELCLIKIKYDSSKIRDDLISYSQVYKNKIIDISNDTITIQVVGNHKKVNNFIKLISKYKIKEIARTGITGMNRG